MCRKASIGSRARRPLAMWRSSLWPVMGPTEDNKYYFLPADVDIARLQQTAAPQDEIRKRLVQIRGTALFFFDTLPIGLGDGRAPLGAARCHRRGERLRQRGERGGRGVLLPRRAERLPMRRRAGGTALSPRHCSKC